MVNNIFRTEFVCEKDPCFDKSQKGFGFSLVSLVCKHTDSLPHYNGTTKRDFS